MFRCGQIMLSTRDNGEKIKQMDVENSGMQMVIYMKASGKMTKLMAMESTSM